MFCNSVVIELHSLNGCQKNRSANAFQFFPVTSNLITIAGTCLVITVSRIRTASLLQKSLKLFKYKIMSS